MMPFVLSYSDAPEQCYCPGMGPGIYADPIRYIERASIREFLTQHASYFRGKVLDYGCGDQPYKDLILSQGAEYIPYDTPGEFPYESPSFDVVLCTQVLQYTENPTSLVEELFVLLKRDGTLILTYPTNWDEVTGDRYGRDHCDTWRCTKLGMERVLSLLIESKPAILHHELRAVVQIGSFRFPLGYGLIARRES